MLNKLNEVMGKTDASVDEFFDKLLSPAPTRKDLTKMTIAEHVQMAQPVEVVALSAKVRAEYVGAFEDMNHALQRLGGDAVLGVLPFGSGALGISTAQDNDCIVVLKDYADEVQRSNFLNELLKNDWVRCGDSEYEGGDGEFVAMRNGEYNAIVMGIQEAACAEAACVLMASLQGMGLVLNKAKRAQLHEDIRVALIKGEYVPEKFDFGNPPRVD